MRLRLKSASISSSSGLLSFPCVCANMSINRVIRSVQVNEAHDPTGYSNSSKLCCMVDKSTSNTVNTKGCQHYQVAYFVMIHIGSYFSQVV